jgi:hypothetical protein
MGRVEVVKIEIVHDLQTQTPAENVSAGVCNFCN